MDCYASLLEQQRRQLPATISSASSYNGTTGGAYNGGTWQRNGYQQFVGTKTTTTTTTTKPSGKQRCPSSIVSSSADSGRGSPLSSRPPGPRGGASWVPLSGRRPTSDVVGDDEQQASDANSSSPAALSKLSPVSGQSTNDSQSSLSIWRGSMGRTASRSRTNPLRQRTSGFVDKSQPCNSTNDTLTSSKGTTTHSINSTNCHQSRSQAHQKRAKLLPQQHITREGNINCNIVTNNRVTISISELRIPLMWRDVDHFKGKGDYRRYAIFCLLKINSQIYDTQLLTDVDRDMTDVNFDDVIVFNDVEHDFELVMEVYSCVYLERFSLSSTPRRLKEKFSNSLGRAMGRRLANQTASSNFTRELDAYHQERSYRFTMIASASFRLEDAQNSVVTYDLALVTPEAHHRRPSSIGSRQALQYQQGNSMTLARGKLLGSVQQSAWSPWTNQSTHGGGGQQILDASNISSSNSLRDQYRNTLPLFGHFCCNLSVRPDVYDKYVKTGYL